MTKVTGMGGKTQLLDDFSNRRRYWGPREEAEDRESWKWQNKYNLDFKRKIWTWTGIRTSDLQITSLVLLPIELSKFPFQFMFKHSAWNDKCQMPVAFQMLTCKKVEVFGIYRFKKNIWTWSGMGTWIAQLVRAPGSNPGSGSNVSLEI